MNKRLFNNRHFWYVQKILSAVLIVSFVFGNLGSVFNLPAAKEAKAAQATIDTTADPTGDSYLLAGSQTVFISDQTGYKFYRDSSGECAYSKTTNGGNSWGSAVLIDDQGAGVDCLGIAVWYDRWTPGGTGDFIHIATYDNGTSDVWYNRIDTANSDVRLVGATAVQASAQANVNVLGANSVSITKGTDGTIYIAQDDATDSFVVECSVNCQLTASWTETGTSPQDLANDYSVLVPLSGGSIMIINRDISANTLRSKIWNNTAWSGAWTNIDTNAPGNTTYDIGMAVTVSPTTNDLYLAYIARNATLGADDQIRTARYTGGAWAVKKEVVRYSEYGLTNLAIALNSANDDVYVAYSGRTTAATANTANVYWRKSTDDMVSWNFEQGPVNSGADDIYGVDLNLVSNERISVSWFDNTDDDIYIDTIADIYSGVNLATVGFGEVNSSDSYSQATIDATVSANGTVNIQSGSQTVFTTDQVGYKFFRDVAGYCVYRKTSNGGGTWSSTTTVDSQIDCTAITVWYDRWTPGGSGSNIHIATMDTGNDDVWYNRLDTTSDTLLLGSSPISMLTNTAQGGTSLTEGENFISITKGTDGTIYAISNDGTGVNDSFILECTTNCQLATGWTETGTNPLDVASDQNILMPLSSGNIMLINRDISADIIRFKTWNNTAWSGSWTSIAPSSENATYDIGMAVAASINTGDLYLAHITRNVTLGTDDQIRSARYTGGAWATTTNIVSLTSSGITNVALSLDSSNDDVYVAYSMQATAATANTANVLWKKSTTDMTTWSKENGPINTSPDDLYGVDLNLIDANRIYVSWFDNTDDDIYGATLVDLPSTAPEATGVQIATTTASSTGVYIGGVFALYNTNEQTYSITGITITESGTIDAKTDISNIKLFYEKDTTTPYDCASVSYGGSETQYGSVDANGFSGTNGVSSFFGTTVTVSSTSALCMYPVMDIKDSADNNTTIELSVANASTDVVVTGSTAFPSIAQDIPNTTTVRNDGLSQIRYHWRNDDGTETTATSKTGGIEGVDFSGYTRTPVRLRMEVSNEGGSTTPAIPYRLEYALSTTSCALTSGWIDVGAVNDAINMYPSANITDGNDSTNIGIASGGTTDENTTFKTPNGGLKDTSSQTGAITLSISQFTELEYSIIASTTAQDGTTYCFRVSNAGIALETYSIYPSLTIRSDINVVATSTQATSLNVQSTNQYLGGKFAFTDATGSHTITSVKLTENGTVNAQTGLDNIRLKYDFDTTAPYNCLSETYIGTEPQYGATSTTSFSSTNGTTSFSGSLLATTTRSVCMYVVLDVTSTAQNGETIEMEITNASTDVTLVSGGVAPATPTAISGATTLAGAILTQSRYHWRNDNGSEAAATSKTSGNENTAITNIDRSTQVRLRTEISNEGSITSPNTALRLEYGTKITTCSAVSSWIDVGASGGAFDMFNSSNLTEGGNTTNIALGIGGVTDDNTTFLTPNSAIKETSSQVATTTVSATQFIEPEFSIKQTTNAGYETTYCFRLSNAGTALQSYTTYPELTTSAERDFEIQRGTSNFAGTSLTLTAGVDYVAPSASTSAFVRITNSNYTGAGDSAAGGTQNAKDVTAYILNPANLLTSFTISRPATAIATTTRVSWEIVEYIGASGGDNEIKVRKQGALTYVSTALTATSTAVTGIVDDNDVAVFITGQLNPDTLGTDYNTGQSISRWLSASDQASVQRGEASADASIVSYAVVEFTGVNWKVQRTAHVYTSAGVTETNSITALNSLSRTFVHAQKISGTGLQGEDEFGHEVWISSIGAVSFFLESGASTPASQTSVAWIIENTQTSNGSMQVTRSDGFTTGGAEPLLLSVSIGVTLSDLTNSSIFVTTRGAGTGTLFPRPIAGVTLASTTHYELWRSDTGTQLNYRTEVVQWPTAGLSFSQNDYRLYADNNALDPTDPWPSGIVDLGENSVLTGADEPLGDSERIRIRMSLQAVNATFPAQSRSFKLQYGKRVTSCSAISESNWTDIGTATSSTIWRAYNASAIADGTALSLDPPSVGALNLTVSDVAGSYEEANNSIANPFVVSEDADIEYDWHIQQYGAVSESFYCFRMVESNGTALTTYLDYPQIRTSSFTPKTQNWRWYSDAGNETPTTALASENTAPTNIANGSTTKLRVTVKETENIARDDVRFRLQYSEYADFSNNVFDVVATTTCTATSTWCYYNGGGSDNEIISTKVLSDAESCSGGVGNGCATHNESAVVKTGFRHKNNTASEYEFTVIAKNLRPNAVYYFRLYDQVQAVPAPINTGETYPSVVAEGAELVFTVAGLTSGASTEGVILDITSTPATIPFGTLTMGTEYEGAYRLNVNTNATEGYSVLMYTDQQLVNSYGSPVPGVSGTNSSPSSWVTGCSSSAIGCFGYHAGDDSLRGGSARFGANDSFAQLSTTTAQEIMYSSIPANDTHDIVYKVKVTPQQPAGDYQTTIIYLVVPVF